MNWSSAAHACYLARAASPISMRSPLSAAAGTKHHPPGCTPQAGRILNSWPVQASVRTTIHPSAPVWARRAAWRAFVAIINGVKDSDCTGHAVIGAHRPDKSVSMPCDVVSPALVMFCAVTAGSRADTCKPLIWVFQADQLSCKVPSASVCLPPISRLSASSASIISLCRAGAVHPPHRPQAYAPPLKPSDQLQKAYGHRQVPGRLEEPLFRSGNSFLV